MASNSLTPYISSAMTQAFALQSTTERGAKYLASGRSLSTPYSVEIVRKLTPPSASGNDHIILRVQRTEANVTTGKLATMQISVDFSIPKDQSVLGVTEQRYCAAIIASLLDESTAISATQVNVAALLEGRDL